MLTLSQIIQNPEEVINRLKVKHYNATGTIHKIIELDSARRKTQKEMDDLQSEANNLARKIGDLYKEKKADEANKLKEKTTSLKESIKELNLKFSEIENTIRPLLVELPNLPHSSVNAGTDERDNILIRQSKKFVSADPSLQAHWDIGTKAGIIDFETGNRLTGSGFPVYMGKGAKLQRALINFFLDQAVNAGYMEIEPPLMVNETTAFGTCQLPDKEGQMYVVNEENFYLIPTAEVPLTNMFRDRILEDRDIPVKITAYTPCFRREAGSYGKNVRGLNRVHQFDKVEIVQIQFPEKSYETLEEMVGHVETLVQKLDLPYRIVRLCGKDMSFASALTYDFEVFSPAQDRWLEVSSVSNFESFQSARMSLRYRDANKKTQLLHTLNGSALALPRIVAALLENNQEKDFIHIPQVLLPYTGFDKIEF